MLTNSFSAPKRYKINQTCLDPHGLCDPVSRYNKNNMIIHPINRSQYFNHSVIKKIKTRLKHTIRPPKKPAVGFQSGQSNVQTYLTSSQSKREIINCSKNVMDEKRLSKCLTKTDNVKNHDNYDTYKKCHSCDKYP